MEYDIWRKKGADRGYLINMPEKSLLSLDGNNYPKDNYPTHSNGDISARDLDIDRLIITSTRDQRDDSYHNFRKP